MSAADAHESRSALAQLLIIIAGSAGACALGWKLSSTPADAPELRIPVLELHSQAAEVALLARELDADKVTGSFARAQARQLSNSTLDTARELTELDVVPELAGIKQAGIADGRELADTVARLREGQDLATEDAERLRERLGTLERALRR